jgi:hypothetical protein
MHICHGGRISTHNISKDVRFVIDFDLVPKPKILLILLSPSSASVLIYL